MEKLRHKLSITNKGFSLFEIVAALFILSTSIIVLYNLILSTNISILSLDDHYHSKDRAVAGGRVPGRSARAVHPGPDRVRLDRRRAQVRRAQGSRGDVLQDPRVRARRVRVSSAKALRRAGDED